MTMRSIVIAIRVRGHLRMGGASDRDIKSPSNHRCRVSFLGAPSPGVRALHARTPTSPRARGEVRKRPRRASFSPDSPAASSARSSASVDQSQSLNASDNFHGIVRPGRATARGDQSREETSIFSLSFSAPVSTSKPFATTSSTAIRPSMIFEIGSLPLSTNPMMRGHMVMG